MNCLRRMPYFECSCFKGDANPCSTKHLIADLIPYTLAIPHDAHFSIIIAISCGLKGLLI